MSYLNGIQNAQGLGELGSYTRARLAARRDSIQRLLDDDPGLNGLGKTSSDVMPFSEVVERYNNGISRSEIEAWVWYKRSVGVPMKGWENYFLKSGERTQNVKVKAETIL